MRWQLTLALALTCVAQNAYAESPLDQRVKQIRALLVDKPVVPPDLFAPSFQKAVPPDQVATLCAKIFNQAGAARSVTQISRQSEFSAKYEVRFEKSFTMLMTIGIDAAAPHAVSTLWFGGLTADVATLDEVRAAIVALPGKTSLLVARLGSGAPTPILQASPDQDLAIGSAFKLYVLGTLAAELAENKRALRDTVVLKSEWRSLPSGTLQSWPIGLPVTLGSLAASMISVSDNTATDHLLYTLGRTRIESQLGPMGMKDPASNRPFLATNELFRLKLSDGGTSAAQYTALSESNRRQKLDDLARIKLDEIKAVPWTSPRAIDVEWIASAADLVRAMDWLRRKTESGPAAALRGVLAINPGVDIDKARFAYLGFKGGSEPGVLDMTYLVQTKAGTWFALSATWNDPAATLDEARFIGLVKRALELLPER
jgi:beta-lactamase class A